MSKLTLISLLAAVAVGFGVLSYGVAYLVASARTDATAEPRPLATGAGSSAESRSDLPDADVQIAFWSKRVSGSPRAYIDMTYLGQAYARKAREANDIRYFGRAEAALRRALSVNAEYVPAAASLAGVLFSLHEFDESLAVAQPIADTASGLQALAVVGDVHVARGQYARAQVAYSRLLAWAESPAAYSRLALLADLRGETDRALGLMDRAARLAQESGDYEDSLAWYAYQIGELAFRAGRVGLAESHYRAALGLFEGYPLALAGLAKAKAAQGDHAAAIRLYRRATEAVPQPELVAALGDVYATLGKRRQAREQYQTVELIGRLAKANRQLYNRQLAMFYADHDVRLGEALRLSLAELRVRKDVYGYDAAAWASYKNGLHSQAQRLIAKALSLGTRDAELYYHAGMIAGALGRHAEERRLLSEALRLNPHFDVLQAPQARAALERLRR